MATSIVSICNLALSWLGANLITSIDAEQNEAKLCKANYDLCRDAALEAGDWTFAVKRIRLLPLAVDPVFGEFNEFQLPADCLRVMTVSDDGTDRRTRTQWELEDRKIQAFFDKAYVRYISRVTDPTRYSPTFIHVLAARLCADITIPITESQSMRDTNWQYYEIKLGEARANDGMQGRRPLIRSDQLQMTRISPAFMR